MTKLDVYDKELTWDHREGGGGESRPAWLAPSIAGAVVAIIAIFFLGARAGHPTASGNPTAAAMPPTAVAAQAPTVPPITVQIIAPTPAALPVATATSQGTAWLAIVRRQEAATNYDQAASAAQSAIQEPQITPDERALFQEAVVADGLKALLAQPFQPTDIAAAQRSVEQYQQIEADATRYHVQLPAYRQSADEAYARGENGLAKFLWERALGAGEITTSDREQIRFYYATLYNVGFWYLKDQSNQATVAEGVRYLVTAHQISLKFKLGEATAWGLLRERLGPDEQTWPTKTVPTPLLETKGGD